MKTTSARVKNKIDKRYVKQKGTFKLFQVIISVSLTALLFYFNEMLFETDVLGIKMLQIFLIVTISVFTSNLAAIGLITVMYKGVDPREILTKNGSYGKFFSVSMVYSLLNAFMFTFGIFWIIYYTYGDGSTLSLFLIYMVAYVFIEFFSYGIVTWLYEITGKVKHVETVSA